MKTFGTLEYQTKMEDVYHRRQSRKKRKKGVWLIKGFRPTLLLSRIIPDSWADERGVIEIADSKPNIEHLDMVMYRFPLEIKSQKKWDERIKQMKEQFKLAEKIQNLKQIEPSSSFNGKLFPFQKKGLEFLMKTNGHALLADEMGLGKTVQTLAYIATVKKSLPVIIVAPLVVLRQWESEIKKFLKVECEWYKKLMIEPTTYIIRSGKRKSLPKRNFYIINYDLLYKRAEDLLEENPKTLVMDEVQYLRNTLTAKYEGMQELATSPTLNNVIGLSGTPIYNRGSEIWGIIDLIEKGLLSTYSEFCKSYCWSDFRGRDHVIQDKQDALAELLRSSIMLRRLKKDVLKELPEKTRYKQLIEIDQSHYEQEITKLMNGISVAKEKVNATNDNDKEVKKYNIMELNKLYVHAIKSERQIAGISKVNYVAQHIEDMMEVQNKIVVFVHHRIVHELLRQRLSKFNPVNIVGGQTDKQRHESIQMFQNNESCRLMIAGLRAGNVGISLTSASYVVHAELDWSPAIHRQAEDRLHRIGQTKEVFSYYLVGEGTLDDQIVGKLVDKALEIDAVMGDKREEDDQVKAEEKLRILQERIMKIKNK